MPRVQLVDLEQSTAVRHLSMTLELAMNLVLTYDLCGAKPGLVRAP